jgi:hypothetical protein
VPEEAEAVAEGDDHDAMSLLAVAVLRCLSLQMRCGAVRAGDDETSYGQQ